MTDKCQALLQVPAGSNQIPDKDSLLGQSLGGQYKQGSQALFPAQHEVLLKPRGSCVFVRGKPMAEGCT